MLAARQSSFVEFVYVVGNRSAAGQPECSADLRRRPAGRIGAQGHRDCCQCRRDPCQDAAHREAEDAVGRAAARAVRPLLGEAQSRHRATRTADRRLEQDAAAEDARSSTAEPGTKADPKTSAKTHQRKQPVRTPLPAHLPRETVTHEPACTCPGCGGTKFSRIGQDEREVLEYVPSSFKVIQHVRPKLSCRSCETIVQAPMPSLPIERGRPGPGLIAHVLVSKYCDHTPLHRQSVIYAREGVELDRATLADWVGKAEFLLSPWLKRSAGMFAPAPRCMQTTPPSRCSRPAWERPKPDGFGSSCATSGPGARRCHRRCSIATRRIARASTPRRCLALAGAFCMPTGMPDMLPRNLCCPRAREPGTAKPLLVPAAHNVYLTILQPLQEGHQGRQGRFVLGRLILAGDIHACQRFGFHFQVNLRVDVGRVQ